MNPERSQADNSASSATAAASGAPSAIIPSASLDAVQLEQALPDARAREEEYILPPRRRSWLRWAAFGTAVCLLIAGGTFIAISRSHSNKTQLQSGNFGIIHIPLKGLAQADTILDPAERLEVNGTLQVAGSVLLTPNEQPSNPQRGELYYDKTTDKLNYFDGQGFQTIGGGNIITNVTNILSGTGQGVQLQATSPGTQQTGNLNISGTAAVGKLQTTVISSNGGTLYINPQGATAQQTVAAGTPATVGVNQPGAISTGSGWRNEISATKVTLGDVGGVATSISVYFESVSPGDHVQVGLYADDGDIPSKPAALLAASASVPLTTNGFTTIPIPTANLSANNTYWLAVNTDSLTAIRTYNGNNKASCFRSSVYGFMPDPFHVTGCFYDDNNYAIYLNYLLGAGVSGALSQAAAAVGPTGQVLFQNTVDSNTAFQVQNAAGTSTVFNVDTLKGYIGIGKTTPAYKLDIAAGDINLSNGRSIRYGGLPALSVNSTGMTTSITNFIAGGKISAQGDNFVVQDANASHQNLVIDSDGTATFSNRNNSINGFRIQNANASTTVFNVDTTTNVVTVTTLAVSGNVTINGHIISGGTTPTIAGGAAACTTPTVSVAGTDTAGTITVTTGTGCASGGTLATLTFATAFASAPRGVVITPGSSASLTLGAYIDNAAILPASFVIATNNTATNGATYKWNYIIIQ